MQRSIDFVWFPSVCRATKTLSADSRNESLAQGTALSEYTAIDMQGNSSGEYFRVFVGAMSVKTCYVQVSVKAGRKISCNRF